MNTTARTVVSLEMKVAWVRPKVACPTPPNAAPNSAPRPDCRSTTSTSTMDVRI